MKKSTPSLVTALVIAVLGVVMIIIRAQLRSTAVVMLAGILFLLAAAFNALATLREADRPAAGDSRHAGVARRVIGWTCSLAGLVLGVCMLWIPEVFTPVVPWLFGGLLILGALYHAWVLLVRLRHARPSGWWLLLPALMAAGGIWDFTLRQPGDQDDPMLMTVTGVAMALFGLASVVEALEQRSFLRRQKATAPAASSVHGAAAQPQPSSAKPDQP